ncbi:MAG: 2-oxoacid:acceptor oxidoreductase family protein [Deltaproteobacteria bacterium]|nr:2-oxoacid:acceptor oxidoreductase family protein [Deltaproteobacteria bacterium]
MKDRIEILASGFGGQGVVRLGQIVGTSAVKQGFRVTMLKSHGTEQRGGYVRTQLVLSKEEIDSPLVEDPDYFCSFSTAAYKQFSHMMKDGIMLYDPATVEIDESKPFRQIAVAAKETAVEKLGRPIYANTIMLGALTGATAGLLEKENMLETMLKIIPKFKEENKKAFELGYSMTASG